MDSQRRCCPMLVGLLLLSWGILVQPIDLSALAHHPHLCETSRTADGRHYPGFFCPRLSDSPEQAYCCHMQALGGSCCTLAEFEALYQVNLSSLPSPPIFRGPGPLLALGFYSLLLAALMTADLVHFCRGRGLGRPSPAPQNPSPRCPAQPSGSLFHGTAAAGPGGTELSAQRLLRLRTRARRHATPL